MSFAILVVYHSWRVRTYAIWHISCGVDMLMLIVRVGQPSSGRPGAGSGCAWSARGAARSHRHSAGRVLRV
jgi:hypothetical protein